VLVPRRWWALQPAYGFHCAGTISVHNRVSMLKRALIRRIGLFLDFFLERLGPWRESFHQTTSLDISPDSLSRGVYRGIMSQVLKLLALVPPLPVLAYVCISTTFVFLSIICKCLATFGEKRPWQYIAATAPQRLGPYHNFISIPSALWPHHRSPIFNFFTHAHTHTHTHSRMRALASPRFGAWRN
jgi:hypothetical protein